MRACADPTRSPRSIGVLGVSKRPGQHQREGDDAHLRQVRALVKSRRAPFHGQRHAQLFPIALARILQLFERRAQDVLDKEHATTLGHEHSLRRDGTVRDARMPVQRDNRREELSNEIERCVQVRSRPASLGIVQDLDQPDARRAVGHQRDGAVLVVEPIDFSYARVIRVLEIREPGDALAQRKIECRNVGDLVVKAQNFQRRFVGAPCGGAVSPAKTVFISAAHGAARSACHVLFEHSRKGNAENVPDPGVRRPKALPFRKSLRA